MTNPRIYADFQNLDDRNRLRLNTMGTQEDIAPLGITLREGLSLTLYSDDADDDDNPDELIADATVQYNKDEKCWVAKIDWNALRHTSDGTL